MIQLTGLIVSCQNLIHVTVTVAMLSAVIPYPDESYRHLSPTSGRRDSCGCHLLYPVTHCVTWHVVERWQLHMSYCHLSYWIDM